MYGRRTFLILFRKIHLYLGVFCAPALLFFAFTGALQTFSLHETTRGSDYRPPHWAQVLAQLHKKQTINVPQRKAPAGSSNTEAKQTGLASTSEGMRTHHRLPMQIFFLVISVGLMLSTLTGLYMTWVYERNPVLLAALFLAGIAIPLMLTMV
ncbi:PepSY domain-containing protein [Silvibacterium dinghuense]|uniref:PepSY domain-containing protein n=1 Tax=Silvibacterium dinghuense TaxID=1560006 RepID=A0A4Q1SGX5_9BACT|nr:PepSY domain-containing protein [Silvibacterium dinghuense]RXS96801.1 PepSY domain-containing protein [Silvibacterium dinghuense]GGG93727.1 hypothetical protein GCM10011586_05650 [Silvibacterium dinghuense]